MSRRYVCHEEVSRKGEAQPCDIPAVAFRLDEREGGYYPVCIKHVRRPMLALGDVIDGGHR